jgi:peptidylprolyl isomerase
VNWDRLISLITLLALSVLAIGVHGCGGDSGGESAAGEETAIESFSIPVKGEPPYRYEAEVRRKEDAGSGLLGSEPRPVIPDQPPPDFIALYDLIEGIGSTAFPGTEITVQYAGFDYETGRKFASSWEQGKPLTFTLGAGEAIEGWEQGLEEMEVGDRRELIVPPALARGGAIPGNVPQDATSVFVVELLRAK